jgi:hypothetical protein
VIVVLRMWIFGEKMACTLEMGKVQLEMATRRDLSKHQYLRTKLNEDRCRDVYVFIVDYLIIATDFSFSLSSRKWTLRWKIQKHICPQ